MTDKFEQGKKYKNSKTTHIVDCLFVTPKGIPLFKYGEQEWLCAEYSLPYYEEYIEPKTYWVNVYKDTSDIGVCIGGLFLSEELAKNQAKGIDPYIKTIEVVI